MKKHLALILLFLSLKHVSYSQETPPPTPPATTYPKTVGYASFTHIIVTYDKNGHAFNFDASYTVSFPIGINLLKSDKIGYSFEMAPAIKVENGTDKVSNIVFHPGVMFRFKHGFTIIQRIAFETSGRYGLTPVFNKVLINRKNVKYFAAIPFPLRFGNDKPASVGVGLQLGVVF